MSIKQISELLEGESSVDRQNLIIRVFEGEHTITIQKDIQQSPGEALGLLLLQSTSKNLINDINLIAFKLLARMSHLLDESLLNIFDSNNKPLIDNLLMFYELAPKKDSGNHLEKMIKHLHDYGIDHDDGLPLVIQSAKTAVALAQTSYPVSIEIFENLSNFYRTKMYGIRGLCIVNYVNVSQLVKQIARAVDTSFRVGKLISVQGIAQIYENNVPSQSADGIVTTELFVGLLLYEICCLSSGPNKLFDDISQKVIELTYSPFNDFTSEHIHFIYRAARASRLVWEGNKNERYRLDLLTMVTTPKNPSELKNAVVNYFERMENIPKYLAAFPSKEEIKFWFFSYPSHIRQGFQAESIKFHRQLEYEISKLDKSLKPVFSTIPSPLVDFNPLVNPLTNSSNESFFAAGPIIYQTKVRQENGLCVLPIGRQKVIGVLYRSPNEEIEALLECLKEVDQNGPLKVPLQRLASNTGLDVEVIAPKNQEKEVEHHIIEYFLKLYNSPSPINVFYLKGYCMPEIISEILATKVDSKIISKFNASLVKIEKDHEFNCPLLIQSNSTSLGSTITVPTEPRNIKLHKHRDIFLFDYGNLPILKEIMNKTNNKAAKILCFTHNRVIPVGLGFSLGILPLLSSKNAAGEVLWQSITNRIIKTYGIDKQTIRDDLNRAGIQLNPSLVPLVPELAPVVHLKNRAG